MKKEPTTPDFLIPGFGKSGTSSLHLYLDQHPDILMSSVKEPHIYSDYNSKRYNNRYNKDSPYSYPNLFKNNIENHNLLLGESSTSYAVCSYAPKLIYQDNPDMKFIIIARDPIERIRSHYNWVLSFDGIEKGFHQEIEDWLGKEFDIKNDLGGYYKYYTDSSLYGSKLQNYLTFFDIKNFLFLSTENLKTQPEIEIKKCFSFLCVDEQVAINTINENQTQKKEKKYDIPEKYSGIKRFVPKLLRSPLKQAFAQKYVVQDNLKQVKEISDKDIAWLKSILIDDIKLFKRLTKLQFPEWKYF